MRNAQWGFRCCTQPSLARDLEQHIPAGTRSVSVFLVNNRAPDEEKPDAAYAFQAKIEVHSERHRFAAQLKEPLNGFDWEIVARGGILALRDGEPWETKVTNWRALDHDHIA